MRNTVSISAVVLLGLLAGAGGVFFGLFYCGGYIWHKQAHMFLMVIVSVLILVVPPKFLGAIWKRISYIAISVILFILVRAASSAFYPVSPGSVGEFLKSFIWGVQYGPC